MHFADDETFALDLDRDDPLRGFRTEFVLPRGADGAPVRYFCGNSLGPQPRAAAAMLEEETAAWGALALGGHFKEDRPWYTYQEPFRGPLGRVVGAGPDEVVVMNSLTVNLHLLLATFYRPTRERFRILMEDPAFPSDLYAVKSQVRHHGLDPDDALIRVAPPEGETAVRIEDIEAVLDQVGATIAVVLIGGVNFLTGQWFDMERITAAGHRAGCTVGFDLAHGAGNVPLRLHDWDVDFAAWCSYKYLNGGPGATAGAFIHRRLASDTALPRLAGWWGNDPARRFRLQLEPEFEPRASADGWQVSNPSVFAMAPLHASLDQFDRAGMERLRTKSVRLTGYLEFLIREKLGERAVVTTPSDPAARGCQLSLRLAEGARETQEALQTRGFVCDFREPDTLRIAPAPLYNSFHDVWALAGVLAGGAGVTPAGE